MLQVEAVKDGLERGALPAIAVTHSVGQDPVLSVYYGVPVIDTARLLAGIDCSAGLTEYSKDSRFFVFEATYTIQLESEPEFTPLIVVSKQPFFDVKSEGGAAVDSPDMCLVGVGHAIGKGYFLRFVNPTTSKVIWNGYFNLSKPMLMMGSSCGNVLNGEGARLVRKRWAQSGLALERAFDPFASQHVKDEEGEEAPADDEEARGGYRTPPATVATDLPKKPRKDKKHRRDTESGLDAP